MFKRARYQQGCIAREGRNNGPDVWIFRWRETKTNGQRINRKVVVGTVEEYSHRVCRLRRQRTHFESTSTTKPLDPSSSHSHANS